MSAFRLLAVSALTLLASVAQAQTVARPAKPAATLGADIKQLLFDWEPAAGATYYQLYVRYSGSPRYVPFGERLAASATHLTVPIAGHLFPWGGTSGQPLYILGACNSAGCTSSSPMDSGRIRVATVGYIKASNTDADDEFGGNLTLSKDGYTLAVAASGEASSATGVNGNQADNSSQSSGAVYVFRRRGNAWQQEAYLKPGVNQPGGNFGRDIWTNYRTVALSPDGSTLAVGAPAQSVGGVGAAGAVYIFRRVQNTWSLVQTLHPTTPAENGWFGHSVDMSDDARTIKVDSTRATDDEGNLDISTHIFLNEETGTWAHVKTLEPFHPGDRCHSSRLDGLGQTLVSSCFGGPTGVRVVTLKGAGRTWVHVHDLPRSMPASTIVTRQPIALNVDSTWMALLEDEARNAVGVFHWNGTRWARAAGLPGGRFGEPPGSANWGADLALSDDGRLLAIGDPSAREGGGGVWPTSSGSPNLPITGAVYVYQRGASLNTWTLRNVVKSPNPQQADAFGLSISLSASGRTLAVGARDEDSNARGVDGDQTNNSASKAGAAYLY